MIAKFSKALQEEPIDVMSRLTALFDRFLNGPLGAHYRPETWA